jgi:phytoene synthase
MHRRHDPTYYWATRRLPREMRPPTHALYGYVRTADQIVDGPRRPPTPEARRAALDAWEGELHHGGPNPVVRALVDAAGRHDRPLGELDIYMRSMRVDCEPVRMRSWDELYVYMDGSTGSVGRIMASLVGAADSRHADFGRLGIAFQYANFIRDVREDARLGRIYLPGEERARYGVPDEDFGASTASPALRALLESEVRRARELFAAAAPAFAAAPASVRPGARFACAAYESVLDRVEAVGYDVLGRRMGVRLWRVPLLVWGALKP